MPNKGYGLGPILQPRQINEALFELGWKDAVALSEMGAVILGESNGHTKAINFNLALLSSLQTGDRILAWDPSMRPPPLPAAAVSRGWPATGVLLTVERAAAGICKDPAGMTTQLRADGMVVTSMDLGLGQLNSPCSVFGTERELDLYDVTKNLHECWGLFLERGMEPWVAFTSGIALDPHAGGQYIARSCRGAGNFLAERAGLAPIPFLNLAVLHPTFMAALRESHKLDLPDADGWWTAA